MNKVCGTIESYVPIKEDRSSYTISYEMSPLEDGVHAFWYEIYIYKKQKPYITFDDVKNTILDDINAQTDEKIVSGFVWTPAIGGNPIPVWLSTENQFNFKSAYDLAVQTNGATLPVTFKMGEDTDGNPVYHTFETMADANDFYLKAVAYVNQCLNEGWARKDAIDWNDYSVFFPVTNE